MYKILARGQAKAKDLWMRRAVKNKCLIGEKSSVNPELIVNHDGEKNLIQIGDSTHILGQLMTFPGGSIKLGNFCYVSVDSRVWSDTGIIIGNRVLISHNVNIFDNQTHPLNPVRRHKQLIHILQGGFPEDINLGGKSVFIEDDVWIGCNSIVLRNVTIGKGAVVGAGSVVTKNVPAWTLVAGNPARVIRNISEECSDHETHMQASCQLKRLDLYVPEP